MQKKLEIFEGKIIHADERGVHVLLLNIKQPAFCEWKNISDFEENRKKIGVVGSVHKFCKLKIQKNASQIDLSYKYIHPSEQSYKSKTIPTASHFYNLQIFVKNKSHENIPVKDDLLSIQSFKDLYSEIEKKDK